MMRILQMHDEDPTKEVLIFCPLPQLDVDGKIFLPINECQRMMGNVSSLEDKLKDLEKLCGNFKDNDDERTERKEEMES